MNIALWVVQGFLAFAFLSAGVLKLTMSPQELLDQGIGFATHMPVVFSAVVELLCGICLILPALIRIMPRLTPLAAVGLAGLNIVAAVTEIVAGPPAYAIPPLVLAGLCGFVAWGRFKKLPIHPR